MLSQLKFQIIIFIVESENSLVSYNDCVTFQRLAKLSKTINLY